MKVLAVGDIHCKTDIIDKVWQAVDYYNRVVFVGDYADDWKASHQDSIDTWKRLKDFQEAHPSKVRVLVGNHDYIYANYTKSTQSGYNLLTQTLIDTPENRELREWLRTLPVTLEIDGVLYSHAGIDESWNGKEDTNSLWADNSPIWTRPDDTDYIQVPQVFGHTPSQTCYEVKPNVWCIDTFSTYPDGTPVGDYTVLEITDGSTFDIKSLENIDEEPGE